ncbi:squamosa promoter-binding-like protein 14 [Salvia splendens]|uniref:squamosa promoter-binding-like protein 14 n=1 Tax=Salvia splendens TaxID=180675 RepID=UPI001C26AC02|nr:squamosa promoter-binding-like protein 14 [Salvia splendens]
MEEVGACVASPAVFHQHLTARFRHPYPMAKKRALPFDSSSFLPQNTVESWNQNSWSWDSARFVAKPLQRNGGQVGSSGEIQPVGKQVMSSAPYSTVAGGNGTRSSGINLVEPQPVSRPNKRVRSGSPGGANYPMCQVDDCREDLSTAKDYHRRHKVCEVHSKAGKALVGKQMQRFCQQCSRFHPLSEFDEGKRSCRHRLAGHNRRRRKTQPEDTSQQLLAPSIGDSNAGDNDILNLLAVLTSAQGNIVDRNDKFPLMTNKDHLMQMLTKINSLQLAANLEAKLNGGNSNHMSTENQNRINGNASSASTKNLLAALSATTSVPSSETQSQPSREGSDSEKSKSPCLEKPGGSTMDVQETSPSLPLRLFRPSPEDYRPTKSPSDWNFLSSGRSCPSEERSPLSTPPVVHDLFPMQTSRDTDKNDHLSNSEGEIACVEATTINGCSTSLQLFGASISGTPDVPVHTSPYRAGYTSSSVSDHSPSSQNSDAADRTGRIIFKLFDKDPSHMPGSLRSQIHNWLSNSPSEMESYIRPGCVVLSLYLSMPSFSWDQLEEDLLNYVKSLVKDIEFWGNGRFLVHTDRQMVSHKEGKIRLWKSLKAWSKPELISVSPVAVVGGQPTTLILRGRSLKAPGTRIHCTHAVGYNVREVHSSLCHKTPYDEIILDDFKVNGAASSILGRCFIEVENSLRGASFPIIIADSTVCQELRLLEPEINGTSDVCNGREESLHFLDELGWLFGRKYNSCLFEHPDYRLNRFKFLLVFSVERDFCALVKSLLDILLELNSGRNGLEEESLELLSEIHLLNRAVKRRCASMVDFLIHYSIVDSSGTSKRFIFYPNMAWPGGLTPLHLAASASSSDDIVDLLTSDPHEVGLHSWNSVLDANGLSPYAYATMRNNHSYNALVAQKLADKSNGQVSVTIEDNLKPFQVEINKERTTKSHLSRGEQSCSKCKYAYRTRIPRSSGLLQRPYIHSMVVVAAVCVCVCLFLRGHPFVGRVSPFSWENLQYGTV